MYIFAPFSIVTSWDRDCYKTAPGELGIQNTTRWAETSDSLLLNGARPVFTVRLRV